MATSCLYREHPGHTDRLDTVAQLDVLRDTTLPFLLESLKRRDVLLSYLERPQRRE